MTDRRWTSSAGPRQYGRSKIADVALDDRVELACALGVGAQGPADAQQVRSEPERVTALDRPRILDPADRRHAALIQPGLFEQLLAAPVGLARPERDRALVGDEQRVELVDEIRRIALGVELVDRRPEPRQELDEGVVLALGDVEVDRVEEAVGRVVEGPPERRAGPLDEDVASGAVMLWAPKARVIVSMPLRIPGRAGWSTADR